MRRKLVAAIAALSLVGAATTIGTPGVPVQVAAAKSCSTGYTHGVINGAHKCLRRGQYCSRPADRQYHRYGFHCHTRDSYGSYHLS